MVPALAKPWLKHIEGFCRHIADIPEHIGPGSITRVRPHVLDCTGRQPSQIGRLPTEDFRLDAGFPYFAVPSGRVEAKNLRDRDSPLNPEWQSGVWR